MQRDDVKKVLRKLLVEQPVEVWRYFDGTVAEIDEEEFEQFCKDNLDE